MNRRWQANKIGLINFWYYDEQKGYIKNKKYEIIVFNINSLS